MAVVITGAGTLAVITAVATMVVVITVVVILAVATTVAGTMGESAFTLAGITGEWGSIWAAITT